MCVTVLLEVSLIIVHFHLVFVRVFSFNAFFRFPVYVCLYASSSSIVVRWNAPNQCYFHVWTKIMDCFFYFFCLSWSIPFKSFGWICCYFFRSTGHFFFVSCSCYGCFADIISHRLRAPNNKWKQRQSTRINWLCMRVPGNSSHLNVQTITAANNN